MVKCPACKRESEKCKKAWTYGPFKVQAYACECGTDFREYTLGGKHGFFLVKKRDKWKWTKA